MYWSNFNRVCLSIARVSHLFRSVLAFFQTLGPAILAFVFCAVRPLDASPSGGVSLLPDAEYFVAVDNVCAWPRLVRLPNGEIAAAIYNNVEHGMTAGDIDLWISSDGGRLWTKRSTVSDHSEDPALVRMNHAMGIAKDGSLVVLVSGWSKGRGPPLLPVQICISHDQGRSWQRSICTQPEIAMLVPYGDIVLSPDGTLIASLYGRTVIQTNPTKVTHQSFTARSPDSGLTWGDVRPLAVASSEVSLLRLRSGKWLAAVRREGGPELSLAYNNAAVSLFASSDEGRTWQETEMPVTLPGQHPASLLELKDGRVLLSYGSRITGFYGVCARLSDDEGKSWSRPKVLVAVPGPLDGGYPSTVEMNDGSLVTAYYAGPRALGRARQISPYAMPWHQRYHMGVCIWKCTDFDFVR